ncbi:MAG TPA: M14 family zinc carboxypeptidase, partial [Acidobacteriota bacterium]|nr:M14 family zinc carboxypeptidase [Acidobacteriota bacterium]
MKFVLLLLLLPSLLFAQQAIDEEYTKKIKEFTTGSDMITDLVDHLPASDTVPSPLKHHGYVAGAADKLTYAEDVYRYMRALDDASPRVKVFSIGKSEEGREMILVAIADDKTIAELDRYRDITNKLSDPRKISDTEAEQLINSGKPFYYATGAMHSPETGSPEMLMELAYRLAVEETPLVQNIRNNIITLITPVLDVDGRNRMVDLIRWYQANPDAGVPPLVYWGKYVAHDNNRDSMGVSLKLSQNILKTFFDYHPQIVHDLHESVPFLYISTGTGPYNPALDPLAINEWFRIAYYEVQSLTQKGLPGVWTYGFYDGWAPNYMFWVAHGHNSIGRFYETFGNSVPSTVDRVVRGESQRAWYRANPALPKVKWSLRNNVNFMQSGLLLGLNYVADNRAHYLRTFYILGKRAIAKATNEGPAAYVLDSNQKRKGQLRDLLTLLNTHGIEVQQADAAFTIKSNWPPKKKEESSEKKDTSEKDSKK